MFGKEYDLFQSTSVCRPPDVTSNGESRDSTFLRLFSGCEISNLLDDVWNPRLHCPSVGWRGLELSIRPRVGGWATLGCSSRLHRRRVGAGQGETRISCCSSPVCGPPTRGRWSHEDSEAQVGFVGLTLQSRRHSLSDADRFSRAAGFITRRVMSTLAAPSATNTQSNPFSSQAAADNSWI